MKAPIELLDLPKLRRSLINLKPTITLAVAAEDFAVFMFTPILGKTVYSNPDLLGKTDPVSMFWTLERYLRVQNDIPKPTEKIAESYYETRYGSIPRSRSAYRDCHHVTNFRKNQW